MVALALGIDPEPLGRRAVHHVVGRPGPSCSPATSASTSTRAPAPSCCRRSARTSAATSWPGMLASGMDRDKRLRLFIDVGTNCEIVLGDGERIVSTAAPAGPAFEGGAIRCGMRAADGAIEVVKITDDDVELSGDRRRRGAGAVRLGPGRRGLRAGPDRACSTRAAASSPTSRPPTSCPASPTGSARSTASGSSRCRGATPASTSSPTRSTSASATCASCSSPRRRSRPAGRCMLEELGVEHVRRPAGAAGRLVRLVPVPRQRGADRPGAQASGACASSAPVTSPVRARR